MEHSKSYYPVQPSADICSDSDGRATGYKNEIAGGVSLRYETALRLFAGMLANPQLRAVSIDGLRELSMKEADKFIAELGDT